MLQGGEAYAVSEIFTLCRNESSWSTYSPINIHVQSSGPIVHFGLWLVLLSRQSSDWKHAIYKRDFKWTGIIINIHRIFSLFVINIHGLFIYKFMNSSWLCCIIGSDTCACASLNKTTKVSQFWSRCRLSSISSLFDVGCCWSCPTVRCWNCAFLLFVHFFIRMSHTPPSPTRTSSTPPQIHTPTHPLRHSPWAFTD